MKFVSGWSTLSASSWNSIEIQDPQSFLAAYRSETNKQEWANWKFVPIGDSKPLPLFGSIDTNWHLDLRLVVIQCSFNSFEKIYKKGDLLKLNSFLPHTLFQVHVAVIMVATSFLSTLFIALAVAAKPVERKASAPTLSFTKHVSGGDIVELDRLRIDLFKGIDIFGPGISSSPAENRAVTYIASVGVGSPPTYCKWLQPLEDWYNELFHSQTILSLTREGERICSATPLYDSNNFS